MENLCSVDEDWEPPLLFHCLDGRLRDYLLPNSKSVTVMRKGTAKYQSRNKKKTKRKTLAGPELEAKFPAFHVCIPPDYPGLNAQPR